MSAILSTVDSCLLACGALIMQNLVGTRARDLSERLRLRLTRLSVVGLGGLAYVLALYGSSVHGLVQESSALGSAGLFVAGLLGHAGRRGARRATVAGSRRRHLCVRRACASGRRGLPGVARRGRARLRRGRALGRAPRGGGARDLLSGAAADLPSPRHGARIEVACRAQVSSGANRSDRSLSENAVCCEPEPTRPLASSCLWRWSSSMRSSTLPATINW